MEIKPTSFARGVPPEERNGFYGMEADLIENAQTAQPIVAIVTYTLDEVVSKALAGEAAGRGAEGAYRAGAARHSGGGLIMGALEDSLRQIIREELARALGAPGGVSTENVIAQGHDLMYVREVAERIGKTEAGLRWMLNQGTAPRHAKIAGRVMFKRVDVEAWISDQFESGDRS